MNRLSRTAAVVVCVLALGVGGRGALLGHAQTTTWTASELQCMRATTAYAPNYAACTQALFDYLNQTFTANGEGTLAQGTWMGAFNGPHGTLRYTASTSGMRPWTAIVNAVNQWSQANMGNFFSGASVHIALSYPTSTTYQLQVNLVPGEPPCDIDCGTSTDTFSG